MPTAISCSTSTTPRTSVKTGSYLDMTYSEQLLIVEITSLEARDDQLKKSLRVEINHNQSPRVSSPLATHS